jgi:hypothetical protein
MDLGSPMLRNASVAFLTASGVALGSATLLAVSCTTDTCNGCYSVFSNCSSCSASGCTGTGFACASNCLYCAGADPICTS